MNDARNEIFTIESSHMDERFDMYLVARYPAISRGALQRLITEGHITVNGARVKATHHPRAGEVVEVRFPEAKPAAAQPEEMPLEILYEDKDLLVLNKAPGIVVHPASGHEEHTLVNALLHHCHGELSGIGGVARPGIVHRLDKDTSGCLVVAKNDFAHLGLAEQFAGRSLEKIYRAILCGEVPSETGEINAAIARHPSHRKRMAVTGGKSQGREARTGYKVVERLRGATYMEVYLYTGRTHQIRVHFQHLGFSVAGDETYGSRQTKKLAELTNYTPPRVLLHAYRLTLVHPRTEKKQTFTAPVPKDMQSALKALRKSGA